MRVADIQALSLHTLSFHLQHIEQISCIAESFPDGKVISSYTLLVCCDGTGKLYREDEVLLFARFSAFLLPPKTSYQLKSSNDRPVTYYKISFIITHINESGMPILFQEELFPSLSELKVYPASQLTDWMEEIYMGGSKQAGLAFLDQNLLFLRLIHFILQHHVRPGGEGNSIAAVEKTIRYLQEHYCDKITVSQLEQLSGVPNGQYSAIFKELTGKRPLDYLTELRIKYSQNLLLETDKSLREIAKRVGFTDEYYFNRKFRQTTGVPPRQYAEEMKGRILLRDWAGNEVMSHSWPPRIIFYGETVEDLLVLGIEPVGGGICLGERQFNIESAQLLKPDLIILDNESKEDYERFSHIAPTLTYNSFAPLEERLSTLGIWFGKEKEAKKWIEINNQRKVKMWQELSPVISEGETATVFIHHRGKRLFVMGTIGLTSVLYHPKGFEPVNTVKEMLNANIPYKEITLDELQSYAGDRVFMLVPSSPQSREALEETLRSTQWKALAAVKQNRTYLIDELTWNRCDANTHRKVVDKLSELLLLGIND